MNQPKTFGGRTAAPLVLQGTALADPLAQYDLGESIGSFYGFLRRARANKHGLVAQVFGENGPDADFISVLHLTRYLDAPVKVSVWMVKDRHGKLFNDQGQRQPLLTEFIGRVRRPLASDMGEVAQFFGENGPNADAVNKLNESRYQDALVLVELQKATPGMAASDIATQSPDEQLEQGTQRLTTEEETQLKRHQKRADQAITALRQHGFFRNEAVLRALGAPAQYADWLCSQPCCHPQPGAGPCNQGPVVPMEVIGGRSKGFALVPLCQEHRDAWLSEAPPTVGSHGGQAFLQSQAQVQVQRWAQEALRRALNVPAGYLPSPGLIYAWAAEHQLRGMLPSGFTHFLDQA